MIGITPFGLATNKILFIFLCINRWSYLKTLIRTTIVSIFIMHKFFCAFFILLHLINNQTFIAVIAYNRSNSWEIYALYKF
jgi:hypothetical protein